MRLDWWAWAGRARRRPRPRREGVEARAREGWVWCGGGWPGGGGHSRSALRAPAGPVPSWAAVAAGGGRTLFRRRVFLRWREAGVSRSALGFPIWYDVSLRAADQ